MANLSKIRRDSMIAFLEELKRQHIDDASIRAFNEIENQLRNKKYGLVWEEHSEEVDELLKDNIPVLSADRNRRLCKDGNLPWNFIIEGDNLQALYLLEKTHRGKVDCIYIDPPYNTGATDWKYNNDYVVKTDSYRHSRWLSMMNQRLKLARTLLTSDGVLICAIDENELATVTLLLQEVFGEDYHIDTICVVHNPRGVQGDNFSYTNEYALFVYRKGTHPITSREIDKDEIDWRDLRDNGHESLREDAATCFYAIRVKDGQIVGFGENKTADTSFHPNRNEIEEDGTINIYPIDKNGIEHKWRYNRESVVKIKHLLRVKQVKGVYDIELGKDFGTYRTVWTDKKYDSNENGTKLINDIVPDNDFDFPKSLYTVYDCIYAVAKDKPNAVIVDFFAGSGTTGHAVLLMNSLLGGNRRFVLCTNNAIGSKREAEFAKRYPHLVDDHGHIRISSEEYKEYEEKYGIARSITFPRVSRVISGYHSEKGQKVILYELKITAKMLTDDKKSQKVRDEVEKIIQQQSTNYSETKLVLEDGFLRVYGIGQSSEEVTGLAGNLKYFKCEWIPRKPEEYLLSDALCLHIKEMIELQNAIEVENVKNVLILNKSDFKATVLNPNIFDQVENIWVNQNIVFNAEELKLLKAKGFRYIPREFFGQELWEAAE